METSGKRCVRKATDFCYQHQGSINTFPDDITDIIYSYTFDDLPSEIGKEIWERLEKTNKLKAFLKTLDIPEMMSYEDSVLYLRLVNRGFSKEVVLDFINGKTSDYDLFKDFLPHLTDLLYIFINKLDRYPHLEVERLLYYLVKNVDDSMIRQLLPIFQSRKLVPSKDGWNVYNSIELYVPMLLRTTSEVLKMKIFEIYKDKNLLGREYAWRTKLSNPQKLQEVIKFCLDQGVIFAMRDLLDEEYKYPFTREDLIRSIRAEDFIKESTNAHIKACMEALPIKDRSIEATNIINRFGPEELDTRMLKEFMKYSPDTTEFLSRLRKLKSSPKYKRMLELFTS